MLYSFRRCPYAIRARMALLQSGIRVELREVILRDKPQALLDASPKGTVPVMVLPDGSVVDESLAIMRWALGQNDPDGWLGKATADEQAELLTTNDGLFKQALDAYKYPERHSERSADHHRAQGEEILVARLEHRLSSQAFLGGASAALTDVAIFPFIRQWAAVDAGWFERSQWANVRRWLQHWAGGSLFAQAMHKSPTWQAGFSLVYFPPQGTAP